MNADPRNFSEFFQRFDGLSSRVTVKQLRLADAALMGWDAYVQRHPDATPYHRLGWLKSVEQAYGHRGLALVAHSEDEVLQGVFPLSLIRYPWGRPKLSSLPFCDVGGPLADNECAHKALIAAGSQLLKDAGASTCEVRYAGASLASEDPSADHQCLPKVRMLLDLPDSSEQLFQSFKPKLRSQIRKAWKNGLVADVSTSASAVSRFYPVFAENMKRLGSPVHSLQWFLELKEAYGDKMWVGLVRNRNQVIAGGVVLRNADRAAIPWASTRMAFNHLAPNMLLYWALLAYSSDHGCRQFDFGRSTLNEGTYRFKRQWGASAHNLTWLQLHREGGPPVNLNSAVADGTGGKLRLMVEVVWRRLPLILANAVGPRIRRYITL